MKSGTVKLKLKRGRKKRPLETFLGSFYEITSVVRNYYQVDPLDLSSKKREVAFPRQVAMYMMVVFTDTPLKDIAQLIIGKPDHSTVLYADRQVRAFCRFNPEIRKQIIDIESMLE